MFDWQLSQSFTIITHQYINIFTRLQLFISSYHQNAARINSIFQFIILQIISIINVFYTSIALILKYSTLYQSKPFFSKTVSCTSRKKPINDCNDYTILENRKFDILTVKHQYKSSDNDHDYIRYYAKRPKTSTSTHFKFLPFNNYLLYNLSSERVPKSPLGSLVTPIVNCIKSGRTIHILLKSDTQ